MGASALIGLAGLGLGGYGAYQSTKAQARQEDAASRAEAQQAAAIAERKASFAKTMDELKGNIDSFNPSGYSPEEMKLLEDKVNFDTGAKGRDLSTSLIQSVLGRNINPSSGAVVGAAGDLATKLQEFSRGKLMDVNLASLSQKKSEELAKRNAQTSYLSAYDKGVGGLNETDLAAIQNQLTNTNAVQGQKGKTFSDLSSALLSSIGDIDPNNPLGVGKSISSGVDYLKGLFKKKPAVVDPDPNAVPQGQYPYVNYGR